MELYPDDRDMNKSDRNETMTRWQRFSFYEDVSRMSDVLFRGPIDPRHQDEMSFRLHCAWRRLHGTIFDMSKFNWTVRDFRTSAVQISMMLETARPPEAAEFDADFRLPDARTLASVLSLRCEKDDVSELLEMYRLVCQKLAGVSCTWCGQGFCEATAAGLFDGADSLTVPATVPKVLVPQCGHAIHTLCFGSQLIPDDDSGLRGLCRRCGAPYAWTSTDVEPMLDAFCLLFGTYVDKRAADMARSGEVIKSAVISIAQVCQCFSLELEGLVSPASAWNILSQRHKFEHPDTVHLICPLILDILDPIVGEIKEPPSARCMAVASPNSIACSDGDLEAEASCEEETGNGGAPVVETVTELFVPDSPLALPGEFLSESEADDFSPEDHIADPWIPHGDSFQ
eukprot:TRINITY_DN67252_c0_g1_i2.p1 TRINITY_DN67252_c0_g1~~TRINITY_DN67252_c0_g1_i2.p1  ORF type:complete len:399 (-),score=46.68 TRINITY_DN67252_c0_g1_i2:45-1241(-)